MGNFTILWWFSIDMLNYQKVTDLFFSSPKNPRIIIPAQVVPDIRCVSTTRQRRVLGKWRSQSTVSHATIVEIGYEGLYIILPGFSWCVMEFFLEIPYSECLSEYLLTSQHDGMGFGIFFIAHLDYEIGSTRGMWSEWQRENPPFRDGFSRLEPPFLQDFPASDCVTIRG